MKGFDENFISELKLKNDIVDVASKYVRLEQRGWNFWSRCPFHHEKTPSFCISQQKQFYHCFGCGKSGDVINFIMELESLDFFDAVKFLAERVKMPLPDVQYDDEKVKEQKRQREKSYAILKDTALFYVANLKKEGAEKHIEYIVNREIKSGTVAKFGIGASLDYDGLVDHLKSKGYSEEEMLLSGTVEKSKNGRLFDALGGRLIIPIINQFGQVVAFGGRLLEKADFAKYKNTKETNVFSKSKTLYNLVNVKKLKNEVGIDGIIIVEGYMDVISMVQAGFENVVASMGTSLTKDQARILKRYTEKVYISYDGDFAGQKASIRGLEILKEEGLEVKVVSLPDGMDPDDVCKKFGNEGYLKLIKGAMPLIDFKLEIVGRTFDISTVDGRRKYVTNALKVIKESPSPAEQEDLLKKVRDLTGYTYDALKRELYSVKEEKKETTASVVTSVSERGDKLLTAGRFILFCYLCKQPFAMETDITEFNFDNLSHKAIQKYIVDKQEAGEEIRFNDIFELLGDDEEEEKSKLAQLDSGLSSNVDMAQYFFDCVRTFKLCSIERKIEGVKLLLKTEEDADKRKTLTKTLSELLVAKNKIGK